MHDRTCDCLVQSARVLTPVIVGASFIYDEHLHRAHPIIKEKYDITCDLQAKSKWLRGSAVNQSPSVVQVP